MAHKLSDIVSKVKTRIKDPGYNSGDITEFINDTQCDVFNDYRLSFMEASSDYTLSAGTPDITDGNGLPSNLDQIVGLSITTDGAEQFVEYKTISEILEKFPDPSSVSQGPAQYWYKYGTELKVFPAPDQAYTATLYYIKKPTELSADADVPEIPSNFTELLVLGAAYRVHEVKDNYDKAALIERRYLDLLQQLVKRYGKRQTARATVMKINRHKTGIL